MEPDQEEFILYLMHPKDSVEYIQFREKYSEAPLVLPTDVWRKGLLNPGSKVEIDFWGKPCCKVNVQKRQVILAVKPA